MSRLLRGLAVGMLILLGLAGLVFVALSGPEVTTAGSSLSKGPAGRDLALGLLRELGFPARPFRGAPAELPAGGGLLILEEVPERVGSEGTGVDRAPRLRARAREHYRRFVDRGGTIVLPGRDPMRPFLDEVFGLDLPPLRDAEAAGSRLRSVVLPDGEKVPMLWDPEKRFAEPAITDPWSTALVDEQGGVLGLRAPFDTGGSVLVFAGNLAFLDNSLLREPGSAVLTTRLAESVPPGRPILFDEYALGAWRPPSVFALAFRGRTVALTLHALALLLVLLLRSAWAGPFPRDPEPLGGATALTRARAAAALWTSAQRWELLAAALAAEGQQATASPREASSPGDSPAEAVRTRESFLARAAELDEQKPTPPAPGRPPRGPIPS